MHLLSLLILLLQGLGSADDRPPEDMDPVPSVTRRWTIAVEFTNPVPRNVLEFRRILSERWPNAALRCFDDGTFETTLSTTDAREVFGSHLGFQHTPRAGNRMDAGLDQALLRPTDFVPLPFRRLVARFVFVEDPKHEFLGTGDTLDCARLSRPAPSAPTIHD
ncbi:MAG: hypothetical protein H6686_06320 [Fibrobacteria bacterium]|nr:hypothetical protein [Fibrobacteria bacterium]